MKLDGHINIAMIFAIGIFIRISGVKSVELFLKWGPGDSVSFCVVLLDKRFSDLFDCRKIKSFTVNTFQLKS